MNSKLIGPDKKHFASLAVDAMFAVKVTNYLGKDSYPVGSVKIIKNHGSSSTESALFKGYALQTMRSC